MAYKIITVCLGFTLIHYVGFKVIQALIKAIFNNAARRTPLGISRFFKTSFKNSNHNLVIVSNELRMILSVSWHFY